MPWQEAAPAASPQDAGAQPQTHEPDKDAAAAKAETQGEPKSENKGVNGGRAGDKTENKAPAKPNEKPSPKSEEKPEAKPEGKAESPTEGRPKPETEGQVESKTTESKAEPAIGQKTEDKAEPEAGPKAELNVGPKKESGAGVPVGGATHANAAGADATSGSATGPQAARANGQHGENPASAPAPVLAQRKAPRKIVVHEGGETEPSAQIVMGMTAEEASSQRQEAEKFLDAADEDLKRVIGRSLDAQQQETVSQVHNYVRSARSALKAGDISRGHTLASKASLLADDLVKH